MKKIWDKIWDIAIWIVVFYAAIAAGLIIAVTIYGLIPTQSSVLGLIISFGLIIGGMIIYSRKAKKR